MGFGGGQGLFLRVEGFRDSGCGLETLTGV